LSHVPVSGDTKLVYLRW